jgi:hypothetical protein
VVEYIETQAESFHSNPLPNVARKIAEEKPVNSLQ